MKIAVLLSGGVDSSVALALLHAQGYDVTAFYLKIWLEDELAYLGSCPWEEDLAVVQAVCQHLAVPLEVLNLQQAYYDTVVAYTIAQIKQGCTPNPDILCNVAVKFGAFYTFIDTSFTHIATGHYAQCRLQDGAYQLHASPDPIKDQTYFLARLTQEQLARALFPIGHLPKAAVRQQAAAFALPNKDRKDSQGICFLGKLKFRDFVIHHVGVNPGPIIDDATGHIIGEHQGAYLHTIGQRQGLALSGGPWYVVAKDIAKNSLVVSNNYYAAHYNRTLVPLRACHWIPEAPDRQQPVRVKLRHGAAMEPCTITAMTGDKLSLQLQSNDQGIAPGQFAVLYADGRCYGGGVIE
ncbi:tRNA 2-thiouridine(34) synthase MnmA [Candidatus Dependentiae bacterium]|nr:tRNA 2-thiouridine(34) synthase MnmA [Candidatus Dependentiae bacterium]